MFSMRNLKEYAYVCFDRTTHVFMDKLDQMRHESEFIDIYDMFLRLTLEAFVES